MVVTYTLCNRHDCYYLAACPSCYLEHAQRREGQMHEPDFAVIHEVAYLAATSCGFPYLP